MKFITFAVSSLMLAASSVWGQATTNPGVFANTKLSGAWMFTEIIEFDGTLSGCFMSTSPIEGAYSFENADLNFLSLVQNGQKTKKVAILDVADPMNADGAFDPMGWFLEIGKPGKNFSYMEVLGFKKRHPSNRFEFEGEIDERLLDELAKGQVANTGMGDRPTLVYSLKGSGKAVALWRECDAKLP